MNQYNSKKVRLITMFWLTTFFFLVEIVVGYITNSMALVADSFHMLSDIAALVVAYLSVKVSFYCLLIFIKIFIEHATFYHVQTSYIPHNLINLILYIMKQTYYVFRDIIES